MLTTLDQLLLITEYTLVPWSTCCSSPSTGYSLGVRVVHHLGVRVANRRLRVALLGHVWLITSEYVLLITDYVLLSWSTSFFTTEYVLLSLSMRC